MNNDRPVQLPEKIQYLHEKIDHTYAQLKYSGVFELKMRFIDLIDTTIEKIYSLDSKKKGSQDVVKKKYEEYYNAEENQRERKRIEGEKQLMNSRLKEIKEKEKEIEVESLKIELQNSRILKHNMSQEANSKQKQLKQYIFELQRRNKMLQKENQKLIKINSLQTKEMDNLKEERNRAEKSELEWKQKHDTVMGNIETFNEKKPKYAYRHQDGLKVMRTITNICTQHKGYQRLFLCQLPVKFHIIKITYGIKLGVLLPNRQFQYFQDVSIYERQQMQLSIQNGGLSLVYLKRKVVLKLDKYKPSDNQIVIMLFGKGDSVALDQSE